MHRVTELGKTAGWIAPPDRGINANPVEYQYVKLWHKEVNADLVGKSALISYIPQWHCLTGLYLLIEDINASTTHSMQRKPHGKRKLYEYERHDRSR